MTIIRKIASSSIVASTTINTLTMVERLLNIPFGLIHKVICIGYAEIMELPISIEALHTLTPTTVSANLNGYDKIIDFDDTTYNWAAAGGVATSEDLVVYDLGEIKDIVIFAKTGVWNYNANSVDLMISDDGTNWTTIWQNISPATGVNAFTWRSKCLRTTARYVKVYYNDSSGTTNNFAIASLEVYPVSSAKQLILVDESNPSATLELSTFNEDVNVVIDAKGTTEYSIIEINPTSASEIEISEV